MTTARGQGVQVFVEAHVAQIIVTQYAQLAHRLLTEVALLLDKLGLLLDDSREFVQGVEGELFISVIRVDALGYQRVRMPAFRLEKDESLSCVGEKITAHIYGGHCAMMAVMASDVFPPDVGRDV